MSPPLPRSTESTEAWGIGGGTCPQWLLDRRTEKEAGCHVTVL